MIHYLVSLSRSANHLHMVERENSRCACCYQYNNYTSHSYLTNYIVQSLQETN